MPDGTHRIIIVDDDPTAALVIERICADQGYTFEKCKDAESAVSLVSNKARLMKVAPYELIICDFMLPGMSGLHAIEFLRRNEYMAQVPILAISAQGPSLRNQAIGAGATAYATKPFVPARFKALVASLLSGEIPVKAPGRS
jgi:two-component system phosphate regulon response regulator PhoB